MRTLYLCTLLMAQTALSVASTSAAKEPLLTHTTAETLPPKAVQKNPLYIRIHTLLTSPDPEHRAIRDPFLEELLGIISSLPCGYISKKESTPLQEALSEGMDQNVNAFILFVLQQLEHAPEHTLKKSTRSQITALCRQWCPEGISLTTIRSLIGEPGGFSVFLVCPNMPCWRKVLNGFINPHITSNSTGPYETLSGYSSYTVNWLVTSVLTDDFIRTLPEGS